MDLPQGYQIKIFGEDESQAESNQALGRKYAADFYTDIYCVITIIQDLPETDHYFADGSPDFYRSGVRVAYYRENARLFRYSGCVGIGGNEYQKAIVLVDQIGIEEKKGLPRLEAIIQATKSRIVPVAMASGTTILGMLPLLFDAMFGGMAACIMGGC